MEKTVVKSVALVLIATVGLLGCMAMPAGLTGSTYPITANDSYTEIGPASGSAWGVNILGIPVGELSPAKKAIERALTSSGGDALINNTTMESRMFFLWFVTIYQTKVNGTAVKIQKGGARR